MENELLKKINLLVEGEEFTKTGSWDWNPVTNELAWSPGVCKVLNLSEDTKPTVDAFLNSLLLQDRDGVLKAIQAALAGKPYSIRARVLNPDKSIKTIEATGKVECDANKKPVRMFGIIRDITSLKNAEDRYRILYETSADAIMTLEPPDWKFTGGNPATVKMFGCESEEQFVSLGPWELSPEFQGDGNPSADEARKMIELALKNGSHLFEWTHRKYNGDNFLATVLLTKVNLAGYEFLQATVRNITEERRLALELSKKIEDLEKMNKFMIDRELKMAELKKKLGNNAMDNE